MLHLNIAGWTKANDELRKHIIIKSNADIISLNETHLSTNDELNVPGYTWFGHCRSSKHKRSLKTFGGVGIFVKKLLCTEFNVDIVDKCLIEF